jgi:hypothetical protein
MITIYYGKNSLHCQVAAALHLSGLTGNNVREYVRLNQLNYDQLFYAGKTNENQVYYYASSQDHKIFPKIIKSLEEMYGLNKCELIEVAGPGFYLDVLLRISKNFTNYKSLSRLHYFFLDKVINSLHYRPWKQLT